MSKSAHKAAQMIKAFTAAGVPRSCWEVSARLIGREDLNQFARDVVELGGLTTTLPVAYVRLLSIEGLLAVELLAKALVVNATPTRYMTFYGLVRRLHGMNRDGYRDADTADALQMIYGRGALVIPDVPKIDDVYEAQYRDYDMATAYLVDHVADGGILVMGGAKPPTRSMSLTWPPALQRMLVECAVKFEEK